MFRHLSWLLPFAAVIIYMPFSAQLDLDIARRFYVDQSFTETSLTELLYGWGEIPGLILGGVAGLVYFSTLITDQFVQWKKIAAAVALAFILGPGLLINGIKETWGRPRPKMVEEFGGIFAFRPFYKPNFSVEGHGNKSFPSGHVSMGFFFFSLALAAEREGRIKLFYCAFTFAFALGCALALVRVSQGGHFVSDSILAALIMWWVALLSCRVVYGSKNYSYSSSS